MHDIDSGQVVIRTARPPLLTTRDAAAEVAERWGRQGISDACALTIASWWQSPGREGAAFAQLASTGSVPLQALAEDINAASKQLLHRDVTDPDLRALLMLTAWALLHPSCP